MKLSILLTLILAFFSTWCYSNPTQNCKPQDLAKKDVIDLKAYPSKFIYVDFWASWCEPCRASFPFMNQLQSSYKPEDLTVVGISLDENTKDAKNFLAKVHADFPTMIDSSGKCAEAFGLQGMPSSYIISSNGEVVYTHQGFRKSDGEKISKAVADIIRKK